MPGTIEGGKKAAATNIKRYGKDHYRRLGHLGGAASKAGGYASLKVGKDGLTGPERAKVAGHRAGTIGKRGYKFIGEEDGVRKYYNKSTGLIETFPIT